MTNFPSPEEFSYPSYLTRNSLTPPDNLELLTLEDKACLSYIWSLTPELNKKLSTTYTLQSNLLTFLEHVDLDARFYECLYIGENPQKKYRIHYLNLNSHLLEHLYDNSKDMHLLINIRVNWKSRFYACLVREAHINMTEEAKEGIQWL